MSDHHPSPSVEDVPAVSSIRRLARATVGSARRNKVRFLIRDWFGHYLPRFLKRRAELRDGLPGQMEDLFIFLTNVCNARCKHCFYIEELGHVPGELTLADYKRLAPTLPQLERLIFTGGEAILHPECGDIVPVLAKATRAERITIISNGFMPDRLRSFCEQWIEKDHVPGVLDLLISLDGMEAIHNETRGNPRAWQLAQESLRVLCEVRDRHPGRLDVGVITVITDRNYDQIEILNDHLRSFPGVRQGFEFVRGTNFSLWGLSREFATDYNPPGVGLPPEEKWDEILETLRRINRRDGIANHAFHMTTEFTLEMLRTGRKIVDCVSAGENVGVLYSTGELAVCEFSKAFGNVKDFNMDFETAWRSPSADAMRAATKRCWCTHGCYLSKNIEYSATGMKAMWQRL